MKKSKKEKEDIEVLYDKYSKKIDNENWFDIIINIDYWLLNFINGLFNLRSYSDITDALLALKAVNLINNFHEDELKNVNENNLKKEYNDISNIIEALEYILCKFYNNEIDVQNLQFSLLKNIIEKMFIASIREEEENSNEFKYFYFTKICNALRKAKSEINVYIRQKDKQLDTIGNKEINLIENLENDLVYYFYTYYALKLQNIQIYQDEIDDNKILNKYNPDSVENEKISSIKKFEKTLYNSYNYKRIDLQLMKRPSIMKQDNDNNKDENYITEQEEIEIINIVDNLEFCLANIKKKKAKKSNQISDDDNSICDYSMGYNDDDITDIFDEMENNNKLYNKLRVNELVKILQNISILCILSKYDIILGQSQRGFSKFDEIFAHLKELENYIAQEVIKENGSLRLNEYNNSIKYLRNFQYTSFSLLTLEILFFEQILFLLSFIQKRYGQVKNELFIFLNILNLGPMYTTHLNRHIINKMSLYLKTMQYNCLNNPRNYSVISLTQTIASKDYIQLQKSIYKLLSLRKVNLNEELNKKIFFLFDLHDKFIYDNTFQNILMEHFQKCDNYDFQFFYGFFERKLYILSNQTFGCLNIDDIGTVGTNSRGIPYAININKADLENLLYKENSKINQKIIEMKYFFDFLKRHRKRNKTYKKEFRADKALYRAIYYNMEEPDVIDSNKILTRYGFKFRAEKKYLIMFTTLKSEFKGKKDNYEQLAKIALDNKLTLVIVICYDNDLSDEQYKIRLYNYKRFVKKFVIDGYLFLMNNFKMLKIILNSIFPIKFSEFNINLVKSFIESNKIIDSIHIKTDENI